jgi:hypothetical protein
MAVPEAARDAPNVLNAAVAPHSATETQRAIEMSDTHHNNVVKGIHVRARGCVTIHYSCGIDEAQMDESNLKKRKRIPLDADEHESESESIGCRSSQIPVLP